MGRGCGDSAKEHEKQGVVVKIKEVIIERS
jgi:hypothetical protein